MVGTQGQTADTIEFTLVLARIPWLARMVSCEHISGMSEKIRTFSQASVRGASAGPTVRPADCLDAPQIVMPARLDPRAAAESLPKELGGVKGPEPTRYGDWESKGRCTDF
jgi:hypothetical protein